MLHRQALASKKMEPELHAVLNAVVTVVNFVKSRPLNSHLFSKLCSKMGAEYDKLLFHTEVRWLCRGRVLERVFELRKELLGFLSVHNPTLATNFSDTLWITKLAYLADMFNLLNALNLSTQGGNTTILEVSDKIASFTKKLDIWKTRVSNGISDMFLQLTEFLDTNSMTIDCVRDTIVAHLSTLAEYFGVYLKNLNMEEYDWVRDPFSTFAKSTCRLSGKAEQELVELSCDRTLKIKFQEQALYQFWPTVAVDYPVLVKEAMKVLLPFPTTYICEASFSALAAMKTKLRSRQEVENDLRVCLSTITPRIDRLCSKKQAHPSH